MNNKVKHVRCLDGGALVVHAGETPGAMDTCSKTSA